MRMRGVPVVIIAVLIGSAGLTACAGAGSSSPTAAGGSGSPGSASALATDAGSSGPATPSPSPSATHRVVTTPSATRSAYPTPSAHVTSPTRVTSSPARTGSGGSGSFTVPSIASDNVVSGYGTYAKSGVRVKVTVCAKQTGKAFSVGAEAIAYNSSGASKNVGAVVLNGPGDTECGTNTFLFYTAHLKVHAFIGTNGTITATGPTLTLY